MNFACVVKLRAHSQACDKDAYLDKRLQKCRREDAAIVKRTVAENMARRRFGDDWQEQAEIEEISYNEWMSHIGRLKKGHEMTEAQREHLKNLHEQVWQYRLLKSSAHGEVFIVNARSAREASELLKRGKISVHPRTFWRNSKELKTVPKCMQGLDLSKPAAFVRTEKYEWRRIK